SRFSSRNQAAAYAKSQLAAGKHVSVGMMQIPSGWLDKLANAHIALDDIFFSCKNVAVGSDLLSQAESYCATQGYANEQLTACTLSFYHTGDMQKGSDYAQRILNYAAEHPFNSKNAALK